MFCECFMHFQAASSLGFREVNFGRRGGRNTGSVQSHLILAAETLKSSLTFPVGSSLLAFWNQWHWKYLQYEVASHLEIGVWLQKENLMISTTEQDFSPLWVSLCAQALPLGKMILLWHSALGGELQWGSISHQVCEDYFHPPDLGSCSFVPSILRSKR